jgi:drug/metabolite transporter (DMT)-like permease
MIYQSSPTLRSMRRRFNRSGALSALAATLALGGSFAVTPFLLDYPVYAGQALRYAVAAVFLTAVSSRDQRERWVVTPRELAQLAALALTGLVGFNVALIEGLRSTDPATMGTVVGASPIIMATLGPLIEGRRLSQRILLAALVVVTGSALTYGAGSANGRGLVCALVALVCESAFSLIAIPLLPRLGPVALSAYVTGLAAVMLAVAAVAAAPLRPFPRPNLGEAAALAYLALVVTAFAFIAWYTGVARLGAARAGLFIALLPVTAALGAVALGTGTLTWTQALGTSLVALGLVVGGAGATAS